MKKYTILLISLLFASLNFNLFLKPLNLVTGGTQGLAIVINNFINLKPSTIIFFINIISLIISFIFLRKETTTSAIISTFSYPLFIRITSLIPSISFIENNVLISSITAGVICGLTGGIIYKMNFSSGGITIFNLLLKKYFNIKISISNFLINGTIIIIGYFFFGIKKIIYSLIVIIISSILIHIIQKFRYKKKL
ncbi:MAG: YitT family protein [Candidatus Coprovivens sp.]